MVGVEVAGEIRESPAGERPVVVAVAAIVMRNPAGLCERAEPSANEAADQVAVVGDLPPGRCTFAVEILEDPIVFLYHPVSRFFHR